jgi:hypothetical protein
LLLCHALLFIYLPNNVREVCTLIEIFVKKLVQLPWLLEVCVIILSPIRRVNPGEIVLLIPKEFL